MPRFRVVRRLLAIGAVVFGVAFVAFALARSEPHPSYPRAGAAAAAQRDPTVHTQLAAGGGWDHVRVLALDRDHWRVTFLDGPRYVLDAALDDRGRVEAIEPHLPGQHPPGSTLVWPAPVLLILCALFVLAVAARPLRSLRNADALVIGAGFTTSALLHDERLVAAHVYVGAATLLYAAARCAATAFRDTAPVPARPPASALPADRYLAWITAGLLAGAIVIVVTSTGVSDVAFAGLAGGTLLNHGVSPYGHIPAGVVHGDTYPLLTYVLFMPFAAIAPVHDGFDSLDGALWLNALALAVGALVFFRAWGPRTTLAWLAFPPVLLAASAGGNDVPTAVFVIAALAVFGKERLTTTWLTLAGWVKIAPAAALIPLLARLRGAALVQCLAVVTALLSAGVIVIVAVGGSGALDQATSALRFQFERGSWFSVWRQLDAPALQVALQSLTVAFAVTSAAFAARKPDISLRRYAGLCGALIALIQLSANNWSYAYLPWLLPFILVALFPQAPRRSQPPAPRAP